MLLYVFFSIIGKPSPSSIQIKMVCVQFSAKTAACGASKTTVNQCKYNNFVFIIRFGCGATKVRRYATEFKLKLRLSVRVFMVQVHKNQVNLPSVVLYYSNLLPYHYLYIVYRYGDNNERCFEFHKSIFLRSIVIRIDVLLLEGLSI